MSRTHSRQCGPATSTQQNSTKQVRQAAGPLQLQALDEAARDSPPVQRLAVLQNRANKAQVVQRIAFLPGQDGLMVGWINANGLNVYPLFAGLLGRYAANGVLDNNDAEAITLLFLTMNPAYRNFAHRNIAITYLFNGYNGLHPGPVFIPAVAPPATIGEFTSKYKIFYHLYLRALHAGGAGMGAVSTVHAGMTGLHAPLGNQAQGAAALPGGPVATDAARIGRITAAAAAGNLRFPSQSSAVSHLVKHGAMYNHYARITGTEGAANLGAMVDNYVEDANYAIGAGAEQAGNRDVTLGRHVYTFTTEFERVMVSIAANGANAFIATYFWNEPPAYVNDTVAGNGANPNL